MKIKVNDKEVFASTGGQPFDPKKPVIIFVHGSGLSHITWVLQTRYFAFHGYSVLAVDLPGHGDSEGPALKSIEDMGEWISDLIDAVGIKHASLVGHSQGCLVTMECAARYPDKIKSLSLMGGAAAIPMNPDLLDLAEKGDPKAVDLMMDWAHGPSGHFGGHAVPGLHHINIGGTIVKNGSVINILGEYDKMTPIKQGKKLADAIENSEVVVIQNCGHMILLEEADQALAALKTFIKSNHKAG